MNTSNETILYVDLNKLEANYNYFKKKIKSSTKVIAVVKAYAYGHGDINISKKLESLGVYALWVTDFEEGVILRKSGIKTKIIVANSGNKSHNEIIENNLDVVIYNKKLLELYIKKERLVNIHIKFNTGMNRYGFSENEISYIAKKILKHKHINLVSICSHLASSERKNKFSNTQCIKFNKICESFFLLVGEKFPRHILNSNGIINFPKYQMEMVRIGIGLYGCASDAKLQPISTLKSVITQVRKIKKGEAVGYGESFVAKKNMTIAIVPVGYADGLNRKLSNGLGTVMINNQLCPIIGKISMDNFAVDISKVQSKEGDIVEIFGKNLSVQSIAKKIETIPYEVFSTLNRRLKRIYFE